MAHVEKKIRVEEIVETETYDFSLVDTVSPPVFDVKPGDRATIERKVREEVIDGYTLHLTPEEAKALRAILGWGCENDAPLATHYGIFCALVEAEVPVTHPGNLEFDNHLDFTRRNSGIT